LKANGSSKNITKKFLKRARESKKNCINQSSVTLESQTIMKKQQRSRRRRKLLTSSKNCFSSRGGFGKFEIGNKLWLETEDAGEFSMRIMESP
jgi:hypothetical protein